MSRRIRTAALLSATALFVGGSFSLALAPAAFADDPSLGSLSFTPEAPEIGDQLVVTGTGCYGLNPASPAAASGADAADAADAAASVAPAADAPLLGSVTVTVTGPAGFNTVAGGIETNTTGEWSTATSTTNITLQTAGAYSISASCELAGVGIYDYRSVSFTIEDTTPPPTQANPQVVVNPASGVTPGTSVSVTGTGFNGATTAAVALDGYTTQNVAVDGSGGFSGVSFLIRADQAGGTLNGSVTPDGGVAATSFSVVVSAPDDGTDADGPVPTDTSNADDSGTNVGSGNTTNGGTGYTSSKPTLPNTGTDSLWPGVVGGLLVLSGAGLVWYGRRREQAEPALPTV